MRLIITLAICLLGITIGYYMIKDSNEKEVLPVLNPTDLEEEMVDESMFGVGVGHTIDTFEFTDQSGMKFGSKDLENQVYVAEYFFTTCGTICPKMNSQMQRVQLAFKNQKDFKIVSFTVDPDVDNVEVMNAYAKAHNAISGKWYFLTGEKKDLYDLARKSFFILKPAEAANLGDAGSDFIHTNNFVLIDKMGRIRGYYDGTSTKEVDKLIHDVNILLEEK